MEKLKKEAFKVLYTVAKANVSKACAFYFFEEKVPKSLKGLKDEVKDR